MASARPLIPGLKAVDDRKEKGVKIPTLGDPILIPGSQKFGNCRDIVEFEKLKPISNRSLQIMYRVRDKRDGSHYIIKKFKISSEDGFPKSCIRETNLLKSLTHINIIRSYGVAANQNLQSNYLILDNWECSLEDLIEQKIQGIYDTSMVKYIMKQLFSGIGFLHDCLIIHRNITCDNIVFTKEGILKITGFSSSRFFSRGDMTPEITDFKYRAPELWFKATKYIPAVDMWSAGCLLARLILKDFLFKGDTELEVIKSICTVLGTPPETILEGGFTLEDILYSNITNIFPDHLVRELLEDLLIYNPFKRPDAITSMNYSYFFEEPHACSAHDATTLIRAYLEKQISPEMKNSIDELVHEGRSSASR